MSDTRLEINRSLQHKIASQIKQKGAISFAQFMQMALYEPGLGYYSAGLAKLGPQGDFVTAPEMGRLFARCHASCFAEVLPHLSEPVIVELGAGTGQFCVDVLRSLSEMSSLPKQYVILDVSADLKQVQQERVSQLPKELSDRVVWLEQWHAFEPPLSLQIQKFNLQLESGYRSEFIPNLSAWLQSVVGQLSKGLVMMVDYGYGRPEYYHPQRSTGTIVCHQRHQANFNPYQDVGLQDITAFVDFTAVAEAMNEAGLDVVGFTTQANFLMATKIEQWLDPDGDFHDYYELVGEMKKLIMPEEMGDKFKTIAGLKKLPIQLSAFKDNRLHEL